MNPDQTQAIVQLLEAQLRATQHQLAYTTVGWYVLLLCFVLLIVHVVRRAG